MVRYCSVPQCRTYATESGVSFHAYPKEKELRDLWLAKLKGKPNMSSPKVCSKHFKEDDFLYCIGAQMFGWKRRKLNAGAVPTQNLPVLPLDRQVTSRPRREGLSQLSDQLEPTPTVGELLQQQNATQEGASTSAENLSNDDAPQDVEQPDDVETELECLRREIGTQASTFSLERQTQVFSIKNVEDEGALTSLTCIPSFELFYNIVDVYSKARLLQPGTTGCCISDKDAVLLTFMKLYHNLSYLVIGVLFGIHQTTASDIFKTSLEILGAIFSRGIYWPEKESVMQILTKHSSGFRDCRMVLDCIEIPLRKPEEMESKFLMYSSYESKYIAKVLVCETPGGHISYVSPAYCGRVSDTFVTKESDLLGRCLPYIYSVMVDKGFLINELCLEHRIKLVRSPSLHNKQKLNRQEATKNQDIADARVHVERAIQRMKLFKILRDSFSIDLLLYIDDIIQIIAGLVNVSKSLFSNDKFLFKL